MTAELLCPNCKAPLPAPRPKGCPHCNTVLPVSGASAAAPSRIEVGFSFGAFLRENWIWIVAPIAVALILIVVLMLFVGGDETSPFIYNIR